MSTFIRFSVETAYDWKWGLNNSTEVLRSSILANWQLPGRSDLGVWDWVARLSVEYEPLGIEGARGGGARVLEGGK